MKVDLGRPGTIDVAGEELRVLSETVGETDARKLCRATRTAYRRLECVLAQRDPDPILDDAEAALAAVLVVRPALPGLDHARLELLLKAWEMAEQSLSPAARLALRACSRLVDTVVSAPDKASFTAAAPPVIKDLDDEAASLCAAYLRAITADLSAKVRRPDRKQHYLQRRLARVSTSYLTPALDKHGRAWVDKRLAAALESVAA